ncbi:hypothetical protein H4R20_003519 [Coemansia guatemalensis]|uniref:NAD(P)-binding protein n=1 Tax=Coemansia guatemalensis TaxID=2761395 RepID=A0A9W8LSX9_9FUNG|nr:hypothetical protein H4R20_003519 [Coemansia guatemalensis]
MVALYEIRGKVAVVTGGAQSLGLRTAQNLARLGAKVVVGDLLSSGAGEVDKINKEVGDTVAIFQHCDVTDSAALHGLIDLAVSEFGQLDILINNAGILDEPLDQDSSGKRARACVDVNIRAVIDATNHALRIWNQDANARGVVINMASTAGYIPLEFAATYCATKAAVVMFTKSLAGLAPKVRVNAVAPAWVDTKLIDAPHIGREHFTIKMTGLLDPQMVVDQIVRLIEDESMAGDIVVIRKNEEPHLCKIPKSTDIPAIIGAADSGP